VRDVLTVSARVRVVILSAVRDPLALVEALGTGASGYLLSTGPRTARALHEVMDGRVPIDPRLTELLRDRLGPATASGAGTAARVDRLTPRENTVLGLVALGLTNEQIARELVLSTGTVKLHVQHLIHKLGVANRTQAAVHAARLGLLPPSS
jgi:two-component system response regulator DevR